MVLNGPGLTLDCWACWGLSPVTVLTSSTAETMKTRATMVMLCVVTDPCNALSTTAVVWWRPNSCNPPHCKANN